uniref:Glucuronosyltransferase n=1 Tax=Steinernema glaseri TaxID=37863 RepID=A0A1I7Z7L4_9BILA
MRLLICSVLLLSISSAFKILVYSPRTGQSHVNFLGRISDILVEEGHDVTVLLPIVGDRAPSNGTKLAKTIVVERNPECIVEPAGKAAFDGDVWKDHGLFERFRLMNGLLQICPVKSQVL